MASDRASLQRNSGSVWVASRGRAGNSQKCFDETENEANLGVKTKGSIISVGDVGGSSSGGDSGGGGGDSGGYGGGKSGDMNGVAGGVQKLPKKKLKKKKERRGAA